MLDRFLSRWWSWTLLAVSLVAFGVLATIYYVFCWLVSGLIDAKLLRKEREETLAREGVAEEEIDARLLPRDRAMTLGRGIVSLLAAAAFHYLA